MATVFVGDTVNWIFDGGHVASRFISVKSKTAGGKTKLHNASDHGNEYTLELHDVSAETDPHSDWKILVTPGDQARKDRLTAMQEVAATKLAAIAKLKGGGGQGRAVPRIPPRLAPLRFQLGSAEGQVNGPPADLE